MCELQLTDGVGSYNLDTVSKRCVFFTIPKRLYLIADSRNDSTYLQVISRAVVIAVFTLVLRNYNQTLIIYI